MGARHRKGSKVKRVQITWNQDYTWPIQSVLHYRSCKQLSYVATYTLMWVKNLNSDISFYIHSYLIWMYTKHVARPHWKISLSADPRHMWMKTQKKLLSHLGFQMCIYSLNRTFAESCRHLLFTDCTFMNTSVVSILSTA